MCLCWNRKISRIPSTYSSAEGVKATRLPGPTTVESVTGIYILLLNLFIKHSQNGSPVQNSVAVNERRASPLVAD